METTERNYKVLILVLMEDTLGGGLISISMQAHFVLILVLMEDTLGVRKLRLQRLLSQKVLILVLMEDTLGVHLSFRHISVV